MTSNVPTQSLNHINLSICDVPLQKNDFGLESFDYPGIKVPNQKIPLRHQALDIGGTLCKLIWFDQNSKPKGADSTYLSTESYDSGNSTSVSNDSSHSQTDTRHETIDTSEIEATNTCNGGMLNFATFETKDIAKVISHFKKTFPSNNKASSRIRATGGGAHKFASEFSEINARFEKKDEMTSLVSGLNFLLRYVPNESFTFDWKNYTRNYFANPVGESKKGSSSISSSPSSTQVHRLSLSKTTGDFFPYLLVNIGSGVSVLLVESLDSFQRVSGSSLGGATFVGLCRLMTKISSFSEMLDASDSGDSSNVDLLVGDIYGKDYSSIGLASDVVASSFGKVQKPVGDTTTGTDADIASSLLKMMCNNIAQIAYLNAIRYPGVKKVYFGGSFIRNHEATMAKLSYGLSFWSQNTMHAHFLIHDGFLGAVGAFL